MAELKLIFDSLIHEPTQGSQDKIFDISFEFKDPLGAELFKINLFYKDQIICLKHFGSIKVLSSALKINSLVVKGNSSITNSLFQLYQEANFWNFGRKQKKDYNIKFKI